MSNSPLGISNKSTKQIPQIPWVCNIHLWVLHYNTYARKKAEKCETLKYKAVNNLIVLRIEKEKIALTVRGTLKYLFDR